MNVLHINSSDIDGGAAIAAYRLHQGLLAVDTNSNLLVGAPKLAHQRIASIRQRNKIENQIQRFTQRLGFNYINIISTFDIVNHPFYQQADILNFHNLHNNYFNYLAIPQLTKHKPAVYTLHDMWSFTGHCSYSYDCNRWQTGCGRCPYLSVYPQVSRDATHLEWRLKKWIYEQANLTIVTPSLWLMERAKESILNHFSIYHIPYGIDTEVYRPLDKEQCRAVLGIPINKHVLMFGANKLKEVRKGGETLQDILHSLPHTLRSETVLLTLGDGGESLADEIGLPCFSLGHTSGDRLKAIAYSAADLFLLPTQADNLPLMLQESMACGTPMVSFNVGGVPDLVRSGITGYLAKLGNPKDFQHGVVKLLEDPCFRKQMGQNCRAIAVEEYSIELQAQRYAELYQHILQEQQWVISQQ